MNRPFSEHPNPFGELIGLRFAGWDGGRSECYVDVGPSLLNPNGVLHGAVIYALADTGMGGALMSILEAGHACTTVEIKVSYFRAATEGRLTCTSQVVYRGKRIAFLEASVFHGDDLIARASGTFAIRPTR